MRVTVLGCGGSSGVPAVGNYWGACDPGNPKNRRRRVSILVEHGGTTLLVDTSPDLREQLLDAKVARLDAVLYTHAHADHLHGIDDLRVLNYLLGSPIDAYGTAETLDEIRRRFGYAFLPLPPGRSYYRPCLVAKTIDGPFRVGAIDVVPFDQDHGLGGRTLGFRFGKVAYSVDVRGLANAAFAALEGVETWIVDCLGDAEHPGHAHFALALEWIARVKPRRAVLTHMGFELDYDAVKARCPPGVEPGYDGLVISV